MTVDMFRNETVYVHVCEGNDEDSTRWYWTEDEAREAFDADPIMGDESYLVKVTLPEAIDFGSISPYVDTAIEDMPHGDNVTTRELFQHHGSTRVLKHASVSGRYVA